MENGKDAEREGSRKVRESGENGGNQSYNLIGCSGRPGPRQLRDRRNNFLGQMQCQALSNLATNFRRSHSLSAMEADPLRYVLTTLPCALTVLLHNMPFGKPGRWSFSPHPSRQQDRLAAGSFPRAKVRAARVAKATKAERPVNHPGLCVRRP